MSSYIKEHTFDLNKNTNNNNISEHIVAKAGHVQPAENHNTNCLYELSQVWLRNINVAVPGWMFAAGLQNVQVGTGTCAVHHYMSHFMCYWQWVIGSCSCCTIKRDALCTRLQHAKLFRHCSSNPMFLFHRSFKHCAFKNKAIKRRLYIHSDSRFILLILHKMKFLGCTFSHMLQEKNKGEKRK